MDGRIADAAEGAPNFTSRYDREKLFRLRAEADVLMVGANTVRHELLPPLVRNADLAELRRAAGKPPHPAVVIVSRSLDLPWRAGYFTRAKQPIFVLTTEAPASVRQSAADVGVTVLEAGDQDLFQFGFNQLHARGFGQVLAEGGGTLVHALLARDLVDRFYLTLAPVALGGRDAPLLVNGPSLKPPVSFLLHHCEQVDSELHLEYRRSGEASPA
ncbi:RibD family protein [Acanthopleuribacter pedis]|uniref:RibD family protein n=2 Tax=Acanthopleuribacter pedis TaxID=442870 RepID=A0A8J7U1N1_9BACT|nr:RibD family protein [Acanthopleuribacter pedis]